jgi:hypothetical protein
MQYRARQIDMMNPFVTFHNQRITKNRFFLRGKYQTAVDRPTLAEFQR